MIQFRRDFRMMRVERGKFAMRVAAVCKHWDELSQANVAVCLGQ